jgi:nicotinamide-nucleotide adenylyltransferase
MNQPFDSALFVGRFQHIHIGHESVINKALMLANRLLILVGSGQEYGTIRNPFSLETRMKLIRQIYPDTNRVIIRPLNDLTNEDDITPEWGRYVLDQVKSHFHKLPELMVYGNDEARSRWFDPKDISSMAEFIISRDKLNLSATMMRYYLLRAEPMDRDRWHELTNQHIHKYWDELNYELMGAPGYREIVARLASSPKTWTDHDWLYEALSQKPLIGAEK